MAFQDLGNLSRLKIPEIHFVVFAPTYNVLGARCKVCKQRVSTVRMAHIRLDASRRVDVPQPDSGILGGSQDKL